MEKDLTMDELIDLAREQGVTPEHIFEEGWDEILNPDELLEIEIDLRGAAYFEGMIYEISDTNPEHPNYEALHQFCFGSNDLNLIKPIEVTLHEGNYVIDDGRHRAMLCSMLGIGIPVFVNQYGKDRDRTYD
jgi:hypothetical protein